MLYINYISKKSKFGKKKDILWKTNLSLAEFKQLPHDHTAIAAAGIGMVGFNLSLDSKAPVLYGMLEFFLRTSN